MRARAALAGLAATMTVGLLAVAPGVAGAQGLNDCSGGQTCTVAGGGGNNVQGTGGTGGTQTLPFTPSSSGSSSSLPFTGADVAELAIVGAGALGIGSVLVLRSRRTA
ncbi:MAG: hypothetical protein ACRDYD_01250 [Acidimicrobiales bacterium]